MTSTFWTDGYRDGLADSTASPPRDIRRTNATGKAEYSTVREGEYMDGYRTGRLATECHGYDIDGNPVAA